jgi:hypothetical protein
MIQLPGSSCQGGCLLFHQKLHSSWMVAAKHAHANYAQAINRPCPVQHLETGRNCMLAVRFHAMKLPADDRIDTPGLLDFQGLLGAGRAGLACTRGC